MWPRNRSPFSEHEEELAVTTWSASCCRAEEIWRTVAEERGFLFHTIDVDRPEGRALMERLGLVTVPAVLVDGTWWRWGCKASAKPIPSSMRRSVAAATTQILDTEE